MTRAERLVVRFATIIMLLSSVSGLCLAAGVWDLFTFKLSAIALGLSVTCALNAIAMPIVMIGAIILVDQDDEGPPS